MTLDEQMNEELRRRAGRGKNRTFKESSAGHRLKRDDLDAGYRMIAADSEREAEAAEWVEGTSESIVDERAKSVVDG